ncbi:MAG: signal peptidase I [Opitutaceae bacterium]|nr:signal peptidase I [Verrucomicrobiales bacterium]
MIIRWFLSSTVRQATDMRKHVRKLVNEQRDLLDVESIRAIEEASEKLRQTIVAGGGKDSIQTEMRKVEEVANGRLRPYPNHSWRENIEVLLVAIAVAMGIRTFVLQPFKIPTGSMQPTLFGITEQNSRNNPGVVFPKGWTKFLESTCGGISYYHIVAPEDGQITRIDPPVKMVIFNLKQSFWFNNTRQTIWFPVDDLFKRAGLENSNHQFQKGEDIMKIRVKSGDHLFVDRMTYNFRRPERGEIIVFKTKGIRHDYMNQSQFYIKRLVALGGEKVRIGNDRHLIINDRRLDSSTPRFENVYSFTGEPRDSQYSGHVNGPRLAPLFDDDLSEVTLRPDHFMVMGDNTVNSFDSRAWGDFSANNVIGKSSFIYWPITGGRFGFGYR